MGTAVGIAGPQRLLGGRDAPIVIYPQVQSCNIVLVSGVVEYISERMFESLQICICVLVFGFVAFISEGNFDFHIVFRDR